MRRVSFPLVAICCVLLLAACGRQFGPFCTSMGPGGPGTLSTGAITIATDHSVYDPSDTVHVIITSHLPQTVRLDTYADCPPLWVQHQEDAAWSQTTQPCAPGASEAPGGSPGYHVQLAPDMQLTASYTLSDTAVSSALGRIRFMVYFAVVSETAGILSEGRVASQSVQVCNCRDCSASS